MLKKFNIDSNSPHQALGLALKFIQETLHKCKLTKKDELQANLMAEESLIKLLNHGDFTKHSAIFVSIRKFLGQVKIKLTVPGHEFDFMESLPSFTEDLISPDANEVITNIFLRLFEDRLRYVHKKGFNIAVINAAVSNQRSLYLVLAALVAAVISGVLLKAFASPDVYMMLNDLILVSVKTIYMNALKCVVTPLIFFSMVTCIIQFRNFSEFGRIGSRIMLSFLFMTFIASSIGAGIFKLFRPGDGMSIAVKSLDSIASFTRQNFFISIVPDNFMRPFLSMDMIQLIFLAVIFSMGIITIGDPSRPVREFVEACDKIFMAITKIIIRLIPLPTFCSILSVILTIDAKIFNSMAELSFSMFIGLSIIVLVSCIYIAFVGKINPLYFLKKYYPTFLINMPLSSSTAVPNNMQACERLGISPKLYSFSIPLGATVSLDGSAMYATLTVLMLAKIYGIDVSGTNLFSVILSSAILAVSAPGIPGASLICMSLMLPQVGVPLEALGFIIGIDPIVNLIKIPTNCFNEVASTLVVASRENLLDKKVYFSK